VCVFEKNTAAISVVQK